MHISEKEKAAFSLIFQFEEHIQAISCILVVCFIATQLQFVHYYGIDCSDR